MHIYTFINVYEYIQSLIVIGCAPGPGAGRWGQQGHRSLHTLLCQCPVWETEEQAGAEAPGQKPVQSRRYFKHKQVLQQAACDGGIWSCTRAVGSRVSFPFSARFLHPHPQYNGGFRKSSKPVAKVAVLCSPYERGMPRTCTNMNLFSISFSWSGTVFSFISEAT